MTALTLRDTEMLVALATKVRLFSLGQIACMWWPESDASEASAKRRLSKLAEVELVRQQRVLVAPLPRLDTPVATWQPGEPEPDCGAIAWQLQSRWKEGPRATNIYTAGPAATRQFGGKAIKKLKATFQATHDLGVSAMYLHLLKQKSKNALLWVGEDQLAPYRRGQKLPDAVLAIRAGATPRLVLEFGGSYNKQRVAAFHDDCHQRKLPYEIW